MWSNSFQDYQGKAVNREVDGKMICLESKSKAFFMKSFFGALELGSQVLSW